MREIIKDFLSEFSKQIHSIKKDGIKKQIPNMLTLSRAIAPIIIIPTLLFNKIGIAVIELIIFAITDFLDGKLARKYNCVSDFGVKLDAVCDKFFALGIMIPALIKFPILIINLILEICISYINLVSEFKNNHPTSNMIGKVKTTLLSITLILSYVPNVDKLIVLMASMITFILQVMAFVKYKEIDINEDKKKRV